MWEPGHGEVSAQRRSPHVGLPISTRAYLSAGLPGADWWVAAPVAADHAPAVELDEVERLYTANDLWGTVV